MQAAKVNKANGLYRMSVSMASLAIDSLLKSVLYRIRRDDNLIMGHNHLGIVDAIEARYPRNDGIRHIAKLSRKYFKDSRYSNSENFPTFTESLASDFISYVEQVKNYVDIECQGTIDDLLRRFKKIQQLTITIVKYRIKTNHMEILRPKQFILRTY